MPHLSDNAFGRYVAMGAGRNYEGLAKLLGVSKRTVVRRAKAEDWQARLAHVEQEAQRKTMERAVEDLAAIDERHLKSARAVLARGLEALRNMPINSAAAAVRAIEAAVKLERLVLGRGKDAPAATTHAQLCDAASRIPEEIVQAACEALRKQDAAKAKAAIPEPLVPPVLAPVLPPAPPQVLAPRIVIAN